MFKLKNFMCLSLVCIMSFGNTLNIFASSSEIAQYAYEAENSNYVYEMNLLEKNEEYSIFQIIENGTELNIIIDIANNLYIVNDKIYSEEDYNLAMLEQVKAISENTLKNEDLTLINFLEDKQYTQNFTTYDINTKNELDTNEHTATTYCVSCGQNPMYVPSTGYGSYNSPVRRDLRVIAATTSAGLAAIAAKLPSEVPYGILIKSVSGFFSALLTIYPAYEGSSVNLNYMQQIAYNNRCPKAVREKRIFKVYDVERSYTNDFYASNPF